MQYNYPPQKIKESYQNIVQLIKAYINAYWFKAGLLMLILYVLIVKDITFQISMNATNSNPPSIEKNERAVPRAEPVKQSISDAPMNLLSRIFSTEEKTTVIDMKEELPKPNPPSQPTVHNMNNYANISAILVKDFAKRYDITQAQVDFKRKVCEDYVTRFGAVAVAEMKKYGIPASITLAQGLLESDAGTSRLAKQNNNHFGMKCFSKNCVKGHCSNFNDDHHKDFFRSYSNSWESYRAHSLLLQGNRYKSLKNFGTKNYKDWAHGLKKAGYATDKNYAPKLIKIIEEMKLYEFDKL